jgi:hypothetical protein
MVAGPEVPVTEFTPVTTFAGKVPVMLVKLNRGEKFVIVPPVAVDRIEMK